jgi:hypothetical protein
MRGSTRSNVPWTTYIGVGSNVRYCTRENIHVDRNASSWLIKRFVDPDAEFVFVAGETPVPDAIPFDMYGVEWGHHGNRCTFETILALHDLNDPILRQIGHIIHGADITADSDETLESPGIDLLFRGLRLVSASDEQALERGAIVMDALYAALKAVPEV